MNSPILTVAIVDDEPTARYGLRSYINKTPSLSCVGEFKDAMSLENFLMKNKAPDIILMDIQMPEISGIDFIASRTLESAIIFVTAYEQYAVTSYQLNVCDYLLKPVSYKRFMQAIEKTSDYVYYRRGLGKEDLIFLRADRMIHCVRISEIEYIESLENYVKIITQTERIIIRSTLKELLANLFEKGIVQVHKSFGVNIRRIKTIEGNKITTEHGHLINMTKTYREHLLSSIANADKCINL